MKTAILQKIGKLKGGDVMKKDIIVIVLIGVLFLLVSGSIIASFTFYKEYKDKVEFLEQQGLTSTTKVDALEAKFDNFKSTIDEITSQIKAYDDNIKSVQNTVSLSEEERKNLLAKIEQMKTDLVGVQKDYSSMVLDLRQSVMALKDELDSMGKKPKEVELGKITVKQEEKKDTKQAAPSTAAKAAGSFKSGNVRKVGSF